MKDFDYWFPVYPKPSSFYKPQPASTLKSFKLWLESEYKRGLKPGNIVVKPIAFFFIKVKKSANEKEPEFSKKKGKGTRIDGDPL